MKIRDLGAWFQNPSAGCSSHHGADNYEAGLLGAYVHGEPQGVDAGEREPVLPVPGDVRLRLLVVQHLAEQQEHLLNNAADWLREMTGKYSIPYTVLNNTQAQNPDVRGICQHVNLGSLGVRACRRGLRVPAE